MSRENTTSRLKVKHSPSAQNAGLAKSTLSSMTMAVALALSMCSGSYAAQKLPDLNGTSQGGSLTVSDGRYKSITGNKITQKTDKSVSADVKLSGNISVSGNLYGVFLGKQVPTATVDRASVIVSDSQLSFDGTGDAFLHATSIEDYTSGFKTLTFTNNRLGIKQSTITPGSKRLYISAVGTGWLQGNTLQSHANSLFITDSTVSADALSAVRLLNGPKAPNTDFMDNSVTIDNSHVTGTIYSVDGGCAVDGKLKATNNSITISGNSTVDGYLQAFSAHSQTYQSLEANSNKIFIDSSTINNKNTVIAAMALTSSSFSQSVFNDNAIFLKNGSNIGDMTAVDVETTFIKGQKNDFTIMNTAIQAEDSTLHGDVYGVLASITNSSPQDAGEIRISGTELSLTRSEHLGEALVASYAASRVGSNFISDTQVTFKDSTIHPSEFYANMSFAPHGGDSLIDGTTITVDSSELKGLFVASATSIKQGTSTVKNSLFHIKGDSTLNGTFILSDVSAPNVVLENNKFVIADTADLSQATFYGYKIADTNTQTIRNNAIHFADWRGAATNQIQGLFNFDTIAFDAIDWQDKQSVISLQTGKDSLTQTLVTSGDNGWVLVADTQPQSGESMTLIDGSAVIDAEGGTLGLSEANFDKDITYVLQDQTGFEGNAQLNLDENGSLIMTIEGHQTAEQVNLLAENRATAAAFLSHSSDLVVDALDTVEMNIAQRQAIAMIQGEATRYDTASEIKINGMQAVFGSGLKLGQSCNVAAFFETGDANYRTQNVFLGEALRGDGQIKYYGLGTAARYRFASGLQGHVGLQGGWLRSEMSNALQNAKGETFDISDRAGYWIAQLGMGWQKSLGKSLVELSGRYIHTYIGSGSEQVGSQVYRFDSIESNRLRVSLQGRLALSDNLGIQLGAGWDYEADANAKMYVDDLKAPTQSLKGHTGFADVGCFWQQDNFELQGRLRGYTGVINGWEGQVRGSLRF